MADAKISALTAATTLADADEFVIATSGASKRLTALSLRGVLVPYVHLRDEKSANTDGGGFTSGAWQTRTLNTEVNDAAAVCSLAANQFTLAAGTYRIRATAPGFDVKRHKVRLRNVTDSTTVLVGTSAYTNNGQFVQTLAELVGEFTIAASKALELQHQCENTTATNGFGVASNFAEVEVYAVVELWKVG